MSCPREEPSQRATTVSTVALSIDDGRLLGRGACECCEVRLQRDTNVLLVPYLAQLTHKAFVNQLLAILSICYAAIAIVLMVCLSYPDRVCTSPEDRDCQATSRNVFHNLCAASPSDRTSARAPPLALRAPRQNLERSSLRQGVLGHLHVLRH